MAVRADAADDRVVVMAVGGATKADLRQAILRTRRALSAELRRAEADALRRSLRAMVTAGDVVCAYVPVGSEPGSIDVLDDIAACGAHVLLPVAREADGVPQPLGWGEYRPGDLVAAEFGLREPRPPHRPADAIASASIIVVPALAVDRTGVRLGRGAGFYDRSLSLADPGARRVAVVRDDELVDRLPGEAHDVAMTHALTPGHGLVPLDGS